MALDLAAGLSGWLQLQTVQRLGDSSGEDSARLIATQIVNAQGRYAPAVSALPNNWGSTKKRVDMALRGRSDSATGWYGAIEIKWPGTSFDPHLLRLDIVQDAVRLGFIETGNDNARFLLLGGSTDAMSKLFDKPHPRAEQRESRRIAFNDLLSRDLKDPTGECSFSVWSREFPGAGERVPDSVFASFNGKIKAELLAVEKATTQGKARGTVYVWQCSRTRGRKT